MSSARFCRIVVVVAVVFSALGLMAQSPVGQILGTVHDPTGAAIAGAPVVVTNLATGQSFNVKTDAAGDYLVRELPPGTYSVAASAPNFKQSIRKPITLVAFQNARVDLSLEVGAASESVTVTAEAPQVDTRSNTLGANVNNRLITEMPLNNRNIVQTLNYTPGVQHISAGDNVNRNQQRLNVQGNRAYSTNEQLDGSSMYFAHRGQGIEMPAPDAIQEVQVVTSGVSAEFGRGTAVFAAVTKSGGNQLHGTAWEFIRNDILDSTPMFQSSKPFLRSNDFGGTLGGPIIKDRFFFFLEYQGLRIHQTIANTGIYPPTAAQITGDFTGCGASSNPCPHDPLTRLPFSYNGVVNMIDPARFDPIALKLLQMMPAAPTTIPTTGITYSGPNPISGDGVLGKFDFAATSKDQLSFRWFWDYRRQISPFAASPKHSVPNYSPYSSTQDPKTANLSWTRTWSPTLVTTTRASLTKWIYDEGNLIHTTLADLGATDFVDQFPTGALPTIDANPIFALGATTIDQRLGYDYGLSQDWSWIHGSHELKWGTLVERISYRKPNSSTAAGTFTIDGSKTGNYVSDFLLGASTKLAQSSGSFPSGHYYPVGFYGEDTWKAAKRLTFTIGLRWDIYTAWRERRGQEIMYIAGVQSSTFPTAPLGMVFEDDPQFTYHTAWKNFGPRVGFAWDIFGDGKTSLRGGYGISYDPLVAEPVIHGVQPYSYSKTTNNPGPFSNPYANSTNPFPYVVDPTNVVFKLPAGIEGIFGSFRPMYNQNFSLTFERQLSPTWAITTSYVGNQTRHGYNGFEANPAVYGSTCTPTTCTTSNTDSRRLLAPVYASMQSYSSNLNTSYNAWQTFVTKRAGHGLTVQAHYTWSRAIDECTTEVISGCNSQIPSDPAGNRGASDFDRTHAGVLTYIYEVPKFTLGPHFLSQAIGGWQIAGVHIFQSGNPFTLFTGKDNSRTGVNYDLPNQVGDPFNNVPAGYYFNPAAFVPNPFGTFGDVHRNSLRAPSDVRWDMSVKKVFYPHGERYRLEFRGDINNILNHTVYDAPGNTCSPNTANTSCTSTSFGVLNATVVSGRVMRLGLHLEF